jgi:hypothetical protein
VPKSLIASRSGLAQHDVINFVAIAELTHSGTDNMVRAAMD